MKEYVDFIIGRFFIKPKRVEPFEGCVKYLEGDALNKEMLAIYDKTFQPKHMHFYIKSEFNKSSGYWVRIDLTKRFSKRRLKHIKVALEDMLDGNFEDFEQREV